MSNATPLESHVHQAALRRGCTSWSAGVVLRCRLWSDGMGDDTSAAVMQLMPGLFNASGQLDPLAVASALAQLQHQQHEILPPGSGIGFPPDRSGMKKCGHCQVTSQK